MANAPDFTKMVPGFDFLQNLVKNAGAALPSVGQWVAPTLDPAELEKRISELRTVQYWLEQNARMLGTTIQALEVQRMTLSTLKTMNVQMEDLRDSLQIRAGGDAGAGSGENGIGKGAAKGATNATALPPGSAVDPMQWWGALTQQFNQIAANAMSDSSADVARNLSAAGKAAVAKPASAGNRPATGAADAAPAKGSSTRKAPRKRATPKARRNSPT